MCVRLSNNLLAASPGHLAIISKREKPRHGEPGAVCCGGKVHVGYLFFPDTGGVAIGSANGERMAAFFEPGTYEVLGRVDRVCASCEKRACRVFPRSPLVSVDAPPELETRLQAFRKDVGMMRWRADATGQSVISLEMRAWITLLGGDPKEWAGRGWTNFLHPEDRDAYLARWEESLSTGKPYQNHGRILFVGVWLYIAISGNPIFDSSGQIAAWEGFLHLEPVEKRLSA